jgi:hypothetical protein
MDYEQLELICSMAGRAYKLQSFYSCSELYKSASVTATQLDLFQNFSAGEPLVPVSVLLKAPGDIDFRT